MTLSLFTNTSERNSIDKILNNIASLEGTLKIGTSIINPVIIVSDLSVWAMRVCNYANIPEFGRYYYVNDIKSVGNNLWEITCHVDVLSTYAQEIRAQVGIIERQENLWNLLLDDPNYKVYQNPQIVVQNFSSGFTEPTFILAVAGG